MPGQSMNAKTWSACSASVSTEPVRAKEVLYSQELNPSIAIWLEQLTHHFLSD